MTAHRQSHLWPQPPGECIYCQGKWYKDTNPVPVQDERGVWVHMVKPFKWEKSQHFAMCTGKQPSEAEPGTEGGSSPALGLTPRATTVAGPLPAESRT